MSKAAVFLELARPFTLVAPALGFFLGRGYRHRRRARATLVARSVLTLSVHRIR